MAAQAKHAKDLDASASKLQSHHAGLQESAAQFLLRHWPLRNFRLLQKIKIWSCKRPASDLQHVNISSALHEGAAGVFGREAWRFCWQTFQGSEWLRSLECGNYHVIPDATDISPSFHPPSQKCDKELSTMEAKMQELSGPQDMTKRLNRSTLRYWIIILPRRHSLSGISQHLVNSFPFQCPNFFSACFIHGVNTIIQSMHISLSPRHGKLQDEKNNREDLGKVKQACRSCQTFFLNTFQV